ncbi:phosphonate ABC transporter substrate-binding protein [Roseibium aquae]|uniref:Phosphonate ABC transporter substrate-binding protein n=2 Tax=Roseibium aquae TaxID=1323746 RepID=A0A916TPD1_9HYPH|nr:phosphonate ABC transporter substrate-binding protein [Roseibium aquae]
MALALFLVWLPLPAVGQTEMERFRFGVAVATDEETRARIEPFRLVLEDILDRPVDLYLIDTLGGLVDALTRGDIDYARLSASAYAATFTECSCVEPLVAGSPDGVSDRFHAILVTRAADPAITLADLKGTALGVEDAVSIAGYRVPLAGLAAEGINARTHFSTMVQMRDAVEGMRAVLEGRVAAAFGWSTLAGDPQTGYTAGTLNDLYLAGDGDLDRLAILWRSAGIPYSAHTVRTDLPDAVKRQLRAGLIDLKEDVPGAYFSIEPDLTGGFVPVLHSDYRAVLRIYDPAIRTVLSMP